MSLLGALGVGSQLFTAGANVFGAFNQKKTNDLIISYRKTNTNIRRIYNRLCLVVRITPFKEELLT